MNPKSILKDTLTGRRIARYIYITKGGRAWSGRRVARLYYFNKSGNFGDVLNKRLMDYFGVRYVYSHPLASDLTCIGSNLQEYVGRFNKKISDKSIVNVFGSGFIHEIDSAGAFLFPVKIWAVRGNLTRQRCERLLDQSLDTITLGDPGLLIKRMFPHIKRDKKSDIVGVVCHYADAGNRSVENIKITGQKVILIDVQQQPEAFVKQVAECGFILASAMHGLICADSLGIPNRHIILSGNVKGGSYKFKDYYSVFPKFTYSPVDLRRRTITDRDLERFKQNYSITESEVDKICDGLERQFGLMAQKNGWI